jgi:hypothetical protein
MQSRRSAGADLTRSGESYFGGWKWRIGAGPMATAGTGSLMSRNRLTTCGSSNVGAGTASTAMQQAQSLVQPKSLTGAVGSGDVSSAAFEIAGTASTQQHAQLCQSTNGPAAIAGGASQQPRDTPV